jgi:hypothetical protein
VKAITFLSLSFSVFSSLLAFAAWRLSCFAVNYSHIISVFAQIRSEIYSHRCMKERKGNESPRCPRDKYGRTFKLKSAFSRPDMMDVVCEVCVCSYSAIRGRYVRLLYVKCDVEG